MVGATARDQQGISKPLRPFARRKNHSTDVRRYLVYLRREDIKVFQGFPIVFQRGIKYSSKDHKGSGMVQEGSVTTDRNRPGFKRSTQHQLTPRPPLHEGEEQPGLSVPKGTLLVNKVPGTKKAPQGVPGGVMIDGINGTWFAALWLQHPEKRKAPDLDLWSFSAKRTISGNGRCVGLNFGTSANRCKAFGADTLTDTTASHSTRLCTPYASTRPGDG